MMETTENAHPETSDDLVTTDSVISQIPHSADSNETFQGCSSNNLVGANIHLDIAELNEGTQPETQSFRDLWNESSKTHFGYATSLLHKIRNHDVLANYLYGAVTQFNANPTNQSLEATKDNKDVATMEDSREQIKDKYNDERTEPSDNVETRKCSTSSTNSEMAMRNHNEQPDSAEFSEKEKLEENTSNVQKPDANVQNSLNEEPEVGNGDENLMETHNNLGENANKNENLEKSTSNVQTPDVNLQNSLNEEPEVRDGDKNLMQTHKNLGKNANKNETNHHEEEKQPIVTSPENLRNCDNQTGHLKEPSPCNPIETDHSNAKTASTSANEDKFGDHQNGTKCYDAPSENHETYKHASCLQQQSSLNQSEIIEKMLHSYSRKENVAIALGILNHYHGLRGDLQQGEMLNVTGDVSQACHSDEHSKTTVELKGTCVYKSESGRNKYFIDQINNLNSDIVDIQQISDNYKYLYQHLVKENSKIIGAIKTIYQELEETQRLPKSNPFWSVISSRQKLEAGTTFKNVQKLCDYIKLLHTDQANQESAIKTKTEENRKLEVELGEANRTILCWETTFEQKRKKQVQIIQEQDQKLEKLKKSWDAAEIQYCKKIKDANVLREKQKKEYEAKLEHQRNISKNLDYASNNLLKENAVLKQSLDQSRVELENANVKLKRIELQLGNELEISKRLRSNLLNIKNAIYKQDTTLTIEKENFSKNLNEMSGKIVKYTSQISLEDIKRQTESKVIEQALKRIRGIQNDVKKYQHQISTFQGNRGDKTYLDIKEMLIRAVEKLDTIESQKKKEIQFHRKEAIDYVKYVQDQLERNLSTQQ